MVGYTAYLARIADLTAAKETIGTGMMHERERVAMALELATAGRTVALVSSGDSGIYGMAGLALEMAHALPRRPEIEIIPGVTAACSAGSLLGAPLMLDYASISLSDLLVSWERIEKRLRAAVEGGFVLAVYNPKSKTRTEPFERMCAILLELLPPTTPVGICRAIGLPEQAVTMTDVEGLAQAEVDMRSVLIVGNADCRIVDGWFLNPRGYDVQPMI